MHRILFRIPLPFAPGHFDVASYGVMIAIAAAVAILTGVFRARESGEKANDVLDLFLWVLIAGLVGARVFYLFSDMDWSGESKSLLNVIRVFFQFRQGGLVFYGGLLLAVAVGIAYLSAKKLNVWKFADIAAPSVAIGIAFARIGCYLNGCCWGKRCSVDFLFHVAFPEGSFAAYRYGAANVPVYPTQLMSSLNAAILFVLLTIIYRRRRFDGEVFWLFIAMYSVTRFAIEFLRGDNPRIFLHTFTVSQAVSLVLLPASLVMLFVLRARAKRKAESAALAA